MSEIDDLQKVSDRLNGLRGRVNDIESVVADVSNFRDPRNTQARFDQIQDQLNTLVTQVAVLSQKSVENVSLLEVDKVLSEIKARLGMVEQYIANEMKNKGEAREVFHKRLGRPPKQKNEIPNI